MYFSQISVSLAHSHVMGDNMTVGQKYYAEIYCDIKCAYMILRLRIEIVFTD